MNLLCPNCQKMLTVPEQYAGQLMKCPLCAGTFTVPGLPAAASAPDAPVPAPSFSLSPDAPTSPAPVPTPPPTTGPSSAISGTPPPPPSQPGGPFTLSIWFKPEIVQWIAPGAMVLILIFYLFFPWLGVYPGGQAAAWQHGWDVIFARVPDNPDLDNPDLDKTFHFHLTTKDEEAQNGAKSNRPGFGFLMLLYALGLFLTVAVTVACAVLPFLHLKLPPAVEPFLQWRWAAAGGLCALLFLLLCLQMLWGFPLERSVYAWYMETSGANDLMKKENLKTDENLKLQVLKGQAADLVSYTIYLKFVFFLHLVAIAGAGLMVALERRGNRPPIRLDLVI